MAAGIACNAIAASGLGFVSALHPGGLGAAGAIAGALTGLAIFFPLYLMRGMGAGDVKLMGTVGAFLGPLATVDAALVSFVMGGMLAAVVAVWRQTGRQALENIWLMLRRPAAAAAGTAGALTLEGRASAGKVPYAVAIACGAFAYALLALAGRTFFA
jgi:prepilin peptidase CpaA